MPAEGGLSAVGKWQKAGKTLVEQATKHGNDGELEDFASSTEPSLVMQRRGSAEAERMANRAKSAPRLVVLVKCARGLVGDVGGAAVYVKARCGLSSDKTPSVAQTGSPEWEQLLSLEVPSARVESATVDLKVKRAIALPFLPNSRASHGSLRLALADVRGDPQRWQHPQWLPLLQGKGGELQVQVFFSQSSDVASGRLSVLSATWNVGNAVPPPPPDLRAWLVGCSEQEHHLVCVGAQECNYARPKANKGDSHADATGRAHAFVAPAPARSQQPAAPVTSRAGGTVAAGELAAAAEAVAASQGADEEADGDDSLTEEPRRAADAGGDDEADAEEAAGASGRGARFRARRRHSNVFKEQAQRVRGNYDSAASWEQHVGAALGDQYWLVGSRHMFQTRVLLYARVDVVAAIRWVRSGYEATGIGHVGVNKGGTAVALQLGETRLCFVNSHLAAHQTKCTARNEDVSEIVANLALAPQGGDLFTGFHHTLWMGDLNYRCDYGGQAASQADTPSPEAFAAMTAHVVAGRLHELLATDQLTREIREGRVFAGFKEAPITFPPTFKVLKGERGPTYTPKRSPAWCDRVLTRSNLPHKPAEPVSYGSTAAIATSDHKPVWAVHSVPLVTSTVAKGLLHSTKPSSYHLHLLAVRADEEAWRLFVEPALKAAAAVGPRGLMLAVQGSCVLPQKPQALSTAAQRDAATGLRLLTLKETPLTLLRGAEDKLHEHQDDLLTLTLTPRGGRAAHGVLPLKPAVDDYGGWLASPARPTLDPTRVVVPLSLAGVPAGALHVDLKMHSKHADRRAMEFVAHMMAKHHHEDAGTMAAAAPPRAALPAPSSAGAIATLRANFSRVLRQAKPS